MSEINTNYTRATLPRTHFPDNYTKVGRQKDNYFAVDSVDKIILSSVIVGVLGACLGGLCIALPVCLVMSNMINFVIILTVFTVLPASATAITCLILKPRFKKIVEENEQKKLKLSDIRQIYSRETNQTRPFAEVAADVCFLH